MAVEIARSLEEIDQKVKELNKTLKASGDETRELDKALKLDPKNTEAVTKKMGALQTAVGTAAQKVALLKQKQDEANKTFAKGDISAAEVKKIEIAVIKAENEVRALNKQIEQTSKMKLENTAAGFDKLSGNLKKAEGVAKSFSKVALGLVTALAAAATAFIVLGDEIHDTSTKFRISAEELQLQRNLYAKTTDDAKNYDKALSSLNSVMTSIAKGKGAAYLEALERLGVSTTDSSGATKTAAHVYNEVVSSLSRMTDETEMASLACIIFGENGLNVATVAELSRAEIDEYNASVLEYGLVSSEAAAKADEISTKMHDIKMQTQAATAELMIALLPVILTLIDIAQTTIIPILNTVARWFASMSPQQLQFVFWLLMLIILLPKIIAIIQAIIAVTKIFAIASKTAAVGVGSVSTAATPLIPTITAVAMAVLILVLLFAMLAGKSRDVTSELDKQRGSMGAMQDQYSDMAADMGGTVEMTSSNSTTNTINYDVNINAYGDTPISQEAADMVAESLADKINAELGGKI